MNKNNKSYGLILPRKPELSAPRAGNIFGEDDDSEKEDGIDWVKKALKAEGEKHRIKKQTKLNMQKALNQDPTIFQYDEVYDEMEKKKEEVKLVEKKEAKKSKYIGNLLKAAERRKKEQEHRIERMVQKEREAEGEQFLDKESFVTSAYRAKLEEFKKLEEEEARMDMLEAIGDVTKQPDISGFYRQLYSQTVDKEENVGEKNTNKKLEESKSRNTRKNKDINFSDSSDSSSEEESEVVDQTNIKSKNSQLCNVKFQKTRQYRKRNVETSESESEFEEDRSDQDSYDDKNTFYNSSDEKIDKSQSSSLFKKARLSLENDKNDATDDNDNNKLENSLKDPNKLEVSGRQTNTKAQTTTQENFEDRNNEKPEEKPKVSIWEKRTIGPILEAALQSYYARKAIRLS